MDENRIERLRVLLRATVASDLFDFIAEQAEGSKADLLTAESHVHMYRAQGAASALMALHRAMQFIRDTNPPEEGTIPPAFEGHRYT